MKRQLLAGLAIASLVAFPLALGPAHAEVSDSVDFSTDRVANYAAGAIADALSSHFESDPSYLGTQITATGLVISLVGSPSTEDEAAVAAALKNSQAIYARERADSDSPTVPISFRKVNVPLSTLLKLVDQLGADSKELADKGIQLSSWGPDIATDAVIVHLAKYDEKFASALKLRYGELVQVATEEESSEGSLSRTADSSPWYGGDTIKHTASGTVTTCTSWFSAFTAGAGAPIALTAGHCGAGAWKQNGATFGTVTSRAFSGRPMDAEIIPVSGNGARIWSDPTSTLRTITSVATSDPTGLLTCTDGQTDREVCSVKVLGSGYAVTYNGQTITGLVKAHQTNGHAAFTPGDSGGPVETTSGSTYAKAQGMISAHVTGDNSTGWYLPARTIRSYFNIGVKVG